MGTEIYDVAPPFLRFLPKCTACQPQGLPPLSIGLGGNQIGKPLGLGQIQSVVIEGATGKLSGLSQPESRYRSKIGEKGS